MANNRILVVDDEDDVVRLVGSNLATAGFHVFKAEDGATAMSIAKREMPALIVLDLMLPGISGMDVTRGLKRDPATAPISILILSARAEETERVLGFELGVDDFMAKPFSPRELVLRVKAILSRKNFVAAETGVFRSGTLVVDQERHITTVDGKETSLTAMEFKLLITMMKMPRRVLSREELLVLIWGDESNVGTRTVDTHVRRLREKLGSAGDQILTIRGVGYRMVEE